MRIFLFFFSYFYFAYFSSFYYNYLSSDQKVMVSIFVPDVSLAEYISMTNSLAIFVYICMFTILTHN